MVLDALTKHLFESRDMSLVQLKHLTYKTTPLFGLRSEEGEGGFMSEEGYKYVGFLSKTYVARRDPSTALTGFRIKSLAKGLDRSDPDRKLSS